MKTFVNICVIAMFIRGRRDGEARPNVVTHIVFPAIGAIVDVYLLFSLDGTAKEGSRWARYWRKLAGDTRAIRGTDSSENKRL